jgi:gamma-glutamylputrescine oxidase
MQSQRHARSYYAATARAAPSHAPLEGAAEADVCVVGGGLTGVSAALCLAERGFSVVLLEANRIGWGASGRNGGQVVTGYPSGMASIAGWLGPDDARLVWAMGEEAKAILEARIATHDIRCDFKQGYVFAALKERHMRELREMHEEWAGTYGYTKTRLLERGPELAAHVASEAYVGGLFDAGSGHLHPLNYCLGLAQAAVQAGVRICEGSRVVRLDEGARPTVHTDRGTVRSRFVVLSGNAYMGNLAPPARRKIMPIGNYVGATAPLDAATARAVLPTNAAVTDMNFVLNYYRLSADRRMLWGGAVSYSTVMAPGLPARLHRRMTRVFPGLAAARWEYLWEGYVAITVERTPHFGRIGRNVLFAHGYSGQGVALSGLAGRLLAEAVAGQAERFDVLARLPHTTFAGGRLMRMPLLVLAMTWFRMRDLLP